MIFKNVNEYMINADQNSILFKYNGKKYTYEDINDLSSKIANYLKAFDLPKQSIICLKSTYNKTLLMMGFVFAIWRINCVVAILDSNNVSFQEKYDTIKPSMFVNFNEIDESRIKNLSNKYENAEVGDDDFSYVCCTSGSTNKFKIFIRKHYYNMLLLNTNFKYHDCRCGMRAAQYDRTSSIFTDMMILMANNIPMYLPNFRINVDNFFDIFNNTELDYITMRPSFIKSLNMRTNINRLKSLKYINFVGEPLTKDIVLIIRNLSKNIKIINCFGATELGRISHYEISEDIDHIFPIGKPINDDIDVLILNDDKERCKNNEIGHIFIGLKHYGIYMNYDNSNLYDIIDGKIYMKIGDTGYCLSNGTLVFSSRNIFKVNGEIVNFENIRYHIIQLDFIRECILKEQYDGFTDKYKICLYILLNQSYKSNYNVKLKIYDNLKLYYEKYMLPHWIVIIDNIKYTESYKVDFKNLPIPSIDDTVTELIMNDIMSNQGIVKSGVIMDSLKYIFNRYLSYELDDHLKHFSEYGIDSIEHVMITNVIIKYWNLDYETNKNLLNTHTRLIDIYKYLIECIKNKNADIPNHNFVRNGTDRNILFVFFSGIRGKYSGLNCDEAMSKIKADYLMMYHPKFGNITCYSDDKYQDILMRYIGNYKHIVFIGHSAGTVGALYYAKYANIVISSGSTFKISGDVLTKMEENIISHPNIRLYYGNNKDYRAIKKYPKKIIYGNPNYDHIETHTIFAIKMDYTPFFEGIVKELIADTQN